MGILMDEIYSHAYIRFVCSGFNNEILGLSLQYYISLIIILGSFFLPGVNAYY